MQVQINTDSNIQGSEALAARIEDAVERAMGRRLRGRITRVEVHLSDVNANKGGEDDIRCVMEARVEGLRPVAVTENAPTPDQAVDGAAGKLKTAVGRTLDRLRDR